MRPSPARDSPVRSTFAASRGSARASAKALCNEVGFATQLSASAFKLGKAPRSLRTHLRVQQGTRDQSRCHLRLPREAPQQAQLSVVVVIIIR